MPSTVRFLKLVTMFFAATTAILYALAVFFEPSPREIRHEHLNITLEDQ